MQPGDLRAHFGDQEAPAPGLWCWAYAVPHRTPAVYELAHKKIQEKNFLKYN